MNSHVVFIRDPDLDINKVNVRRASPGDEHGIYRVAVSVSDKKKDSYQGFLMDDYASDPDYYIDMFRDRIDNLKYFYVAELDGRIIGFSLAYKKEMWLLYHEEWLDDIHWHPSFDMEILDDFVMIDKTAIEAEHTGEGIGSLLYKSIISDMRENNIHYILSETIVNPIPNFASLAFRQKQDYILAGVRFEEYKGDIFTDLIYYKRI